MQMTEKMLKHMILDQRTLKLVSIHDLRNEAQV
jgi:hypothetical protein